MNKHLYYKKDRTPIEYEAAYEILKEKPAKIGLFETPLPEDFIDYVIDSSSHDASKLYSINRILMYLGRDRKCFTMDRIKRMAKNAPGSYLGNVPYELKTEEMTVLAVKSCKDTPNPKHYKPSFDGKYSIYYTLRPEQKTEAVTRAYWESGGRCLNEVPDEFKTEEMCAEAMAISAEQLPFVPSQFRTKEYCDKALGIDLVKFIKYVPTEFLRAELCERAIKKSDGNAYMDIDKKFCTSEMAIEVLRMQMELRHTMKRNTGIAVGDIVRHTPVPARTDEFMRLAYDLFRLERYYNIQRPHDRYVWPRFGKPHSAAFERFIKKMDAKQAEEDIAAKALAEKPGKPLAEFSVGELKEFYKALYHMNCEAAEEDYREEYEANYSPASLGISGMPDKGDVVKALVELLNELWDDLGNEDEYFSWIAECGGSMALEADIRAAARADM